jgi:riboflavin biosynthesis pyrimidine reductase
MSTLAPLDTLYEPDRGAELPLPPALATLYGPLRFPAHPDRPHVIGNFVTALDGVVSLNVPGRSGGGEISGFNQHDRLVMGLLRVASDAVIVGAGTLRAVPRHRWTAAYVCPALADAYQTLRAVLGKPGPPLNVIVTASGAIDLALPVFQSGEVPVLIVTTVRGAQRIGQQEVPPSVRIADVQSAGPLSAGAILEVVRRVCSSDLLLVEGGPRLMGDFFAEQRLDELFLTLAPQVAGRDEAHDRPGLVAGQVLAPDRPRWGTLVGVKRAGSHLFLRYAFEPPA